jgi:low temperature requirement protein LtrA
MIDLTQLTHYPMPDWARFLFLPAFAAPIIAVVRLVNKSTASSDLGRNRPFYLFLTLYFAWIVSAGLLGWYDRVGFPPRVLLLTTFPYAFFLFGWVMRTDWYKNLLERATLPDLVATHWFRLVGVFFLIMAYHDALPKFFALLAGMGDVLTAITSVWVANALRTQRPNARRVAFWWNTFGMVDIVLTAALANILTKISIDTGAMGVDTLAETPFWLIPAFAPPTIIFLHVMIYSKLKDNG